MEEDTTKFIHKEQLQRVMFLSSTYTDNIILSHILYNIPIKCLMTYRIVVQNVGLRLHLILRERVDFIRSHLCKKLLKINLRLIKDL
jgi:hypothetical protein